MLEVNINVNMSIEVRQITLRDNFETILSTSKYLVNHDLSFHFR